MTGQALLLASMATLLSASVAASPLFRESFLRSTCSGITDSSGKYICRGSGFLLQDPEEDECFDTSDVEVGKSDFKYEKIVKKFAKSQQKKKETPSSAKGYTLTILCPYTKLNCTHCKFGIYSEAISENLFLSLH